ncbi:MAG TPA: hemolysin family protein, partial [Candidatus Tectomicrobia bacterium]|nr:hemolysin family protein [Candidatus Tectomicrobia bacterium]
AAQPVALGLVVLAVTYASLVVGELAPKALALRDPERLACLVSGPIQTISRMSAWLVRVLTVSTNAVLAVVGVGRRRETTFVTEEEVRYLVREGAAKGIFEKTEEALVQSVFEFADTTVREVMVPRINIQGIPVTATPEEALRLAAEINHSRIPLYRESMDDPVGVLLIKDLLRAVARGAVPPVAELARPPLFVPEASKISKALEEFQRHRQNLAFVVDEYGSLVGLVTVEDILEEIVGEIREEGEIEPRTIVRLPDGSLIVDGVASVEALREAGLPIEDSREYSTAAGFVISALEAIPTAGVAVARSGYRWTVLEMDGPRVRRLKVERVGDGARGSDGSGRA